MSECEICGSVVKNLKTHQKTKKCQKALQDNEALQGKISCESCSKVFRKVHEIGKHVCKKGPRPPKTRSTDSEFRSQIQEAFSSQDELIEELKKASLNLKLDLNDLYSPRSGNAF